MERSNYQISSRKTKPRKIALANCEENGTLAKRKNDLIVEIPLVLRIGPIAIEVALAIGVALDVEHVGVAVRVGDLYKVPSMQTTPRVLKEIVIFRHLKCLSTLYQVSSFFVKYHPYRIFDIHHPILNLWSKIFSMYGYWIRQW